MCDFPWLFSWHLIQDIVHLHCRWDEQSASIQVEGEWRVCPPMRLKLPHFSPCMCPAWTIKNQHNLPLNLRIMSQKLNLQVQNNWCIKDRFFFFFFLQHATFLPCAVRAARDLRLGSLRLPLIKILVWERAAFNVTDTCMHIRAACNRSWANRCTATPQGG